LNIQEYAHRYKNVELNSLESLSTKAIMMKYCQTNNYYDDH